jgi:tetratricopeptide (TPR) repeat protein
MKGATEADALVNASRDLLNSGDPVGAERILLPVIGQFRTDAPVLHLMGLIKKAQERWSEAERYFRSAIAHDLSNGAYYNDLGLILQARGEFSEATRLFRAALVLMPQFMMLRVSIVRCLMAAGDLSEAEREARAYVAASPSPDSWTLLGSVQRAQERHDDALVTAETALKLAPTLRGLRYNYATALDKMGRGREALDIYEKLAKQDLDTAELALNYARALFAEGRKTEAEAVAAKGVELWPGSSPLHAALARMRWLRGEGENCVAATEAAIRERPKDLGLRLTLADALHRGGYPQKALDVLNGVLRAAPDTLPVLTGVGVILDELNRPLDGLKVLRRAAELSTDKKTAQRNMLSTLLRAGQPEEALQIIYALREQDPNEQYLIACATVALRMIGDAQYRLWCDYERLVRTYDIQAPPGYFTAQAFNADLAAVLRNQHKTNAHPLDQYMFNGSQTGRSLLGLKEPSIKRFLETVDDAVRDYMGRLRADEPMGARRAKQCRYTKLWSLRLVDGGYQSNHVHDRGWISSAYYAAVMPGERVKDPRSGWLKFGEANRAPAKCGPEKFIEPKVGTLVLFPSYFWHGTIPFEGGERLSMAFDVVPG